MADGSITFSTALDNKQLEKDLRKATGDVEGLKRKIEKGGDDKTYLATKLKAAMKAAQDARAEVERLQASMGAEGGSKELAQRIREAAKEAEKIARPLKEKRSQRTALEEELDNAIAKEEETIARIEELEAKAGKLRAQGDIRGAGDAVIEASPYKVQLNEQDAKIEELRAKWEAAGAEVEEYEGKLAEANASVANMQGEMEALQAAEANLKQQEGEAASLERKWNSVDERVREYERDLERARGRTTELAAEAGKQAPVWQRAADAIRSRFATVAEGIRSRMASAASRSVSPWEQFSKRVGGLLRRVFLFGLILKGLNAMKSAIGSMLTENERFNASVSNLKATFNGVLSAIVSTALPALTALVNTLSGVLERAAGLVDSVFGTRLVAGIQGRRQAEGDAIRQANGQKQAEYDEAVAREQARYDEAVAKAQERQAKAARKLEKAQEKANRQLMSFDEINAMSAEEAEEATEAMEDYMDGIEGPDLSSIDPPDLEMDWTLGDFGDAGLLQGVLDWLDALRDRILNDVEGPFARIREGLQQIGEGWGEIVEGFRTGDLGLVWQGIADIVIGSCKVIEGAFGALMDWLDEQTGGRFTGIFQGLSEVVSGFEKVIEGVLTGDLGLVAEGAGQILEGLRQTVVGILEGIEGAFGDLMDWLDEQTGGRFHDVFEGMKGTVGGAADFLVGLLTGDIPRAVQGLRGVVDGLAQVLTGTVDAVTGAVKSGVSWVFDFLSAQFPELAGVFQSAKDMVIGVVDGISSCVRADIEGMRQAVQGALDVIVGIFTGDAERILRGIDEVAGGIRTVVDGAAGGVRGVLESLFGWVRDGVNGVFDFLSSKFPEASWLLDGLRLTVLGTLDALEGAVLGTISGMERALDGFIGGVRLIFEGIVDVIAGILTGSGDRIVDGLRGIVNGFISIVEGIIDGVISAIVGFVNGLTDGLSLIPGVDIPPITFSSVSLPRLATGAVIPPNREFMAVLGDQTHGTNIETPEALLRQVIREEIGPMLAEAALSSQAREGGGGDVTLVLKVDGEELSRAVSRGNASRVRRGDLVPDVELGFGL